MKKLILILIMSVLAFAEVNYAEPMPSFEEPRKWLIRVNSNEVEKLNHILNAMNNVSPIQEISAICSPNLCCRIF